MNINLYLLQQAINCDGFQKRIKELCIHHLESDVHLENQNGTINVPLNRPNSVEEAFNLLSQFSDCAGYVRNRRGTTLINLENEGGVQDILYLMLKPAIPDLVPEQPISDKVRQYSIQDFRSKKLKLIIEAKIIRDKHHGKAILKELNDDIGNYKSDPFCEDLIFFIYDPNGYVESPNGIIESVKGTHTHENYKIKVHCIIK